MRPRIYEKIRSLTTHIVDILVERETRQVRRLVRERTQDPRRREVLLGGGLARERETLEVPTYVAQRAGGLELLLHSNETHIEAQHDGLRLLLAALEAREDIRRDAEVRAAEQRKLLLYCGEVHLALRVAGMLERDKLRLRCEPAREGLCPREEAREPLEAERAAIEDPHVVVVHWPWALACASEVVRRRDRQVLQVHQQPHRLRYYVCVGGLRLAVHGAGERQALHAPREVWPCEHRAAEEQQPLLGNRHVLVELGLDVYTERVRDERE